MDEYLFITLAKLKADRLKLAREQRLAEPDPEQLRLHWSEPVETSPAPVAHPVRNSTAGNSVVGRWFSQQPLWREQS